MSSSSVSDHFALLTNSPYVWSLTRINFDINISSLNPVYWVNGVHLYLVRKFYDYEIDIAICKALLKYGSNISNRKLKWIVESTEYLGRTIPIKIFQYHVQKLLSAGYVFYKKEQWKRGNRLPLFLSDKAREQLRLDNLIIEYKEEHSNLLNSYKKLKEHHKSIQDRFKSERRRNIIYYIVMRVLSIETPNKHYRYPSLSIADIINARYDGHAFYYLRLEDDKVIVQECLNNLKREKIVSQIRIPSRVEPSYKLADLRWKSFVTDCSLLLEDTVMMELHLKWQNLRRPSPLERIYYELCWGDRNANGHLIRVYQNFEENEKKSNTRYRQEIEEVLYSIDCTLHQKFINLESKYHDLAIECSSVYNMIIETIYPEFLRKEIERIVNNPKNRQRKRYRLQSAQFKDSLASSDSVQTVIYKVDE